MTKKVQNKKIGKKDKDGHYRGRPKLVIDYSQFEKLCEIQCTEAEIAYQLGISVDTLETRIAEHYKEKVIDKKTGKVKNRGLTFSEAYKKFSAGGKVSLRRVQYRQAVEKENTSMMIWLGQQYLDQSNRQHRIGNVNKDEDTTEYDIHTNLYNES